jgi:hypothetical protein
MTMKQVRFEIAFTNETYWTIAESDWIDLTPGHEDEQLENLATQIENMFESENGFVSCMIGGVKSFFKSKHIVSIKLPTREHVRD